jgi:hypothetical protein
MHRSKFGTSIFSWHHRGRVIADLGIANEHSVVTRNTDTPQLCKNDRRQGLEVHCNDLLPILFGVILLAYSLLLVRARPCFPTRIVFLSKIPALESHH